MSRRLRSLLSAGLIGLYGCQTASTAVEPTEATSARPAAASDSATCGAKGQPDCPLQGWMKSTLQTYHREKDYTRLAKALGQLAEHAPADYARWDELALAGKSAAERKDATAVSQACKGCHNQHRKRFRAEQRSLPLF